MHPQLFLIENLNKMEELTTNDNNNIFISYIKHTNITPPAHRNLLLHLLPFSSPEPPFPLVTWSEKRKALVAAITGCP